MNTDLYRKLAGAVDVRLLTNRIKEMVAIKSENPFDDEPREGYREKEMGQYLAQRLSEAGLEVKSRDVRPGRPNVFGFRKGTGEAMTLMLAGHMDTARTDGYPDAYDVKEEGGKVFGRGSCDMKAALAAYLEAARLVNEAGVRLKGTLIVAGLMDEEYATSGSKDIGRNGPRADQGIIGEPSALTVCPAHKGRVSAFIRTFGKASHSSVPELGQNAIIRMAKAITALSMYNEDLLQAAPHPLCGHGRFSPGVIRGGVQVNMVPDRCELEVDRRTLPGETTEKVYQEIRSYLDPLVNQDPGFGYEITKPTWLLLPNDISPKEPVVKSLILAHEHVTGRSAQATAFPAATDAPYVGFPTVICGPGSIAQAHTTREFVDVQEVVAAVKMYLWVILNLLG